MVYRRNELKTESREKPRDGTGTAGFVHLVEGNGTVQKNTHLLSESLAFIL